MPRRVVLTACFVACALALSGVAARAATTSPSTTSSTTATSSGTSGSSSATRKWVQVTDGKDTRNIDEVGLARTSDDVLHVFWKDRLGANQEAVLHTPVTGSTVGTSATAAGPLASVGNPVAVVTGDGGLRIFFAGLTGSESSLDGVISASSDAKATTWSSPARVSSTTSAIPEGVGAAVAPNGTPAFVYAYSFVLGYHPGLDPATADTDLVPGNACCAYLPNLAFTDSAGTVAWYSNVDGAIGYRVQGVFPSVGTATGVPGGTTDGKAVTPNQRTPIVTREGTNETFVAYCTGYPSCDEVVVWKVGSTSPITVADGEDIEKVNLATDPDGRLWVVWQDVSAGQLYASRSNDDATVFGAPAVFDATDDTDTVWKLSGSATDDHLDVVASLGTSSGIDAYVTSVLPGLGVDATRSKQSVTFVVSDAGTPVKGAKITFRNKSYTTNAKGKAVAPAGKGDATVARTGYTPTTTTVT